MLLFVNHLIRGNSINNAEVEPKYRIREGAAFLDGHRLLLLDEISVAYKLKA
jgi:hypothetical protein